MFLTGILFESPNCGRGVDLIKQGLARLKPGPIYADEAKVIPPPKEDVMTDIGALIHHFKIMSEGFKVPEGEGIRGG